MNKGFKELHGLYCHYFMDIRQYLILIMIMVPGAIFVLEVIEYSKKKR